MRAHMRVCECLHLLLSQPGLAAGPSSGPHAGPRWPAPRCYWPSLALGPLAQADSPHLTLACSFHSRESKRDPVSEGRVKPPASPNADTPDRETEDVPQHKSSADSSANSPAEPTTSPSFLTKPALRSSTSLGQAQDQAAAATTATGTQPPGKHRGGLRSQANSSSQTQAPGQQRARPSTTSSGPSKGPSGSTPQPSTTSSQGPALGQSPSGTTTPTQPPNKTPNGPDASAPKSSRRHQKRPTTKATSSTSVPELSASGQPESSPEYSSESTTEVTYSWPDYRHRLRCLQHCWRMKHLAC